MSTKQSSAVGLFLVGMAVGGVGVVLVALALWAWLGWVAAVGFLGATAIVLGIAILQGKG